MPEYNVMQITYLKKIFFKLRLKCYKLIDSQREITF